MDAISRSPEAVVTIVGTCVICGQPVFSTETGVFIGSLTVGRDGFSRFDDYSIIGHEGCAGEMLRRMGLGPADAERYGEAEMRSMCQAGGVPTRRIES